MKEGLQALCSHYKRVVPPLHTITLGDLPAPTPTPPVWSEVHETALLGDLAPACERIVKKGFKDFHEVAMAFTQTNLKVEFPALCKLLQLALVLPLTSASVERLFSKMRLVCSRLRSMSDETLLRMMFLGVEGGWGPTGIPKEVLSLYVEEYRKSPRVHDLCSLDQWMLCRDAVMHWRETSRGRAPQTCGTQTMTPAAVSSMLDSLDRGSSGGGAAPVPAKW